jgi:PAS domain S-box-containing protein
MGYWQWKLNSDQLNLSNNLYRLLGCEPKEFEPSFENILAFVHKEDRNRLENLNAAMLYDSKQSIEFRIIRKDGQERYLRNLVQIIDSSTENPLIQGTIQDITEEFYVRKQLEEKSSFAEMLIENSVDHIAAYDKDCRLIVWNRKCEDRYGVKKEVALGKHAKDVYPDLKPNQLEDIQNGLNGEFVYRTQQKSSSFEGLIEYFIIPLKDSKNKVFGALSILHDLAVIQQSTDKLNELNQSLELKNRELERTNDEMTSFSYVASHDLQEPLRKIHTFSRLILEKESNNLSEKGKDYFHRMESAALRMQTLIDDLLTFSRTNTLPREFTPTDLNKILFDVKKELKDSIEEKNVIIESSELPKASVISFQFKQLLENLLLNSIKYSQAGVPPHIKVEHAIVKGSNIKLDRILPEKEYLRISVIDNGIGFEPEYAEKIFELFHRLHSKHEYPGTGLGLAICKKIVHNHDGQIVAESIPGEGATFHVYIPAIKNLPK